MRVLICGSRDWVDEEPIRRLIEDWPLETIVIHGAARGADSIAGRLAEERGLKVLKFPAQWDRYGKAAGPIRNRQMLDEGMPDVVYAFAVDLTTSRGTANMIEQARRAGLRVTIFHLDP